MDQIGPGFSQNRQVDRGIVDLMGQDRVLIEDAGPVEILHRAAEVFFIEPGGGHRLLRAMDME